MKIARKGLIALLIATLELAFLPILLEVGASGIGTVQLLVYVFIVGSVASLLVSYGVDKWKGLTKIIKSRNALVITATAGVLNYGVVQMLLTLGTLGTNPSISSVIYRSWVLMLAIMIPFTLRNKLNRYQVIAALLGFAGIFILATGGTGFQLNAVQLPFVLILLASAFVCAVSNLMIKIYSVSTVDSVAIFNIASLAFSLVIALAYGIPISFQLSGIVLGTVLFLGIVTYTLGSMLYFYAFKTLNTVKVANTMLVIPFLTIPLSFLLLGTPIEAYYIYAYVLIALGIVLQQRYSSKAPEYIRSKAANKQTGVSVFDVTGAFVHNKNDVIYRSVAEGKRALAIAIDKDTFTPSEYGKLFEKYDCIAFTNNDPHPAVGKDEIEFITEIMGPSQGQELLICLGDSKNIDEAFAQFTRSSPSGKTEEFTFN
jgi:drug/metabolite transporter (DMT)-like permease